MLNNKLLVIALLFSVILPSVAQDCAIKLSGQVIDTESGTPLSYVNILLQETSEGTFSDEDGQFTIHNICPGEYHLLVSHIGCESQSILVPLTADSVLTLHVAHTVSSLGTVVVEGKRTDQMNAPSLSVNKKTINDNNNKNLSELLESQSGVHLLKNGSGISKPIVQGLYGNRLAVLNNGILQAGQQWGNDHSPEIDPFTADHIVVLKGASAIEYGGGNLGSVLLVEPSPISHDPHLHGRVNYSFETNGFGHNFNTRLEQYTDALAWRVSGTLRKYGDRSAPRYYLNNTGLEEANLALQLEKSLHDKQFYKFYASTFNTRLGILRGAHIGNVTDLEAALGRDEPFFTEPDFSYTIEAPKQEVHHHLIKLESKSYLPHSQQLDITLAGQANNRKEFDIRRSGRSDIPALSLLQYTINSDVKYRKDFNSDWSLKLGNQNTYTNNTNNPNTGILPLIPDYLSWDLGLFSTVSKSYNRFQLDAGFRYQYVYQYVAMYSSTLPQELLKFENNFHNINGMGVATYKLNNHHSLSLNTGLSMRNPAINERYSNGLHQGVSGIERGDSLLSSETAWKSSLEYEWIPSASFSLDVVAYYQHFNDYIYLNPQDEVELTIRGAFPVFQYEQTDANIYGVDVSAHYTAFRNLFGKLNYSFIRGQNIAQDIPLVYIPPSEIYASIGYRSPRSFKMSNTLTIKELAIEINNKLVLKQQHLLADQDYVLPPPTYDLVGLKLSTNLVFPSTMIRFFTKVDNVLNVRYRDYLNRQRYFADDLGFSLVIGANLTF